MQIYITLKKLTHECPFCHSNKIEIKEWKTRKIKHELFFAKPTTFYLKIPRFKCRSCSKTFTQNNSFAPKRGRNSFESISLILKNLLLYNSTFESTAKLFHTSSTNISNIFDTYVNPARKELPTVLSIDEIYNKGQFTAPYSVILFDFMKKKVVDVVLDRKKTNLNKYFCTFHFSERQRVEYVIIDMWEPYLDIAKLHFPNCIVAVDSFHVMQHLGKAVDDCRCRIMRKFPHNSKEYYLLKKYKYLLKKSPKPWEEKVKVKYFSKYMNEYDILQEIIKLDDDLKAIHNYYVRYKFFNENSSYENAKERFDEVIIPEDGIIVKEMIDVISMLQNWKEYIINSFIIVNGTRLSNGPMEGANSQFKKLINVSNGYGNFYRFRNRIIFCYNKELLLSPVSEKIIKIKRKPRGKYKKSRQT